MEIKILIADDEIDIIVMLSRFMSAILVVLGLLISRRRFAKHQVS